jgi:two-component system phosphate regulon response regulator OmpR
MSRGDIAMNKVSCSSREVHDVAQPHLLIVDDDGEICAELSEYLRANGFQVTVAKSRSQAEQCLHAQDYDLLLLDLWLGNESGFDVLRRLRQDRTTPCIMVTAQNEVTDKIVGLELGADDYVVKPVNLRELLARIRALIRRSARDEGGAPPPAGEAASWRFDPARRSLSGPGGKPVSLSTAECDLLMELVATEGLPQSRDSLYRRVFRREWNADDRSLDGIVLKLRRKLEPDPDNPLVIQTVRGRGYVFTGFV